MKMNNPATGVLIADDDNTSRTMLEAILNKWGHDVIALRDGEAAWELLQRPDGPKLALLDWMMPAMDGIEICRRIRLLEMDIPPYLIILTARDKQSDIVEGLEAGADDYIAKPYDTDELRARIDVGLRVIELQRRLQRAFEEARQLSLTDPLTGASNRRAILAHLASTMVRIRRERALLWVSVFDIDHFKHINDTYGHAVGDIVLRECVKRMTSALRPYDAVGRFGGEEFLLVVTAPAGGSHGGAFERVRIAMASRPFAAGHDAIPVTASLGVARWDGEEDADELIRRADEALYRAKEGGRNQVVFAEQTTEA